MSASPVPRVHRVSAHQPIYLGGYLGHWAKFLWCDEWIIFDVCQAEDSGFENRNQIRTKNGAQMLTVPVMRSRETPLSELRIANTQARWAKKHWNAITMAYQRAPYFDLYAPTLRPFYEQEWTLLVDLNRALFEYFAANLGIRRTIRRASEMGLTGTKSALVLDMAVKAKATEYMFGPYGNAYADLRAFSLAGVRPLFQEFEHPVYEQFHGGWVPNLSVLDLLMNHGPASVKVLGG